MRHPLLREDQQVPFAGFASIGDGTWKVQLVRRWAIFPLRAGDLAIGPMSVTMLRPRALAGQKRTTESLQIHVKEPPLGGRPPGYSPGDVGHFTLTAEVNPDKSTRAEPLASTSSCRGLEPAAGHGAGARR